MEHRNAETPKRRNMEAPAGCQNARRGMLLVAVLVILTVLALVSVSFSYWMQADLALVDGLKTRQQARLAAESGLDRVAMILRDQRTNMDNWYNNREVFRRILVWSPEKIGGSESLADQEAIEGQPGWRFSVVATEYEGDKPRMRYGLVDEAGKLNLNIATREQLLALFGQLKLKDVTPEQLTDALMDWMDSDDQVTGQNGAESSYYMTLEPPYRAKNKPLDTVEELLTVKRFNGRILYGEDFNRNGYLDKNEDDGPEGMFPPDNGDGILDRGLLPYITVLSWDINSANDNKPRININAYRFANTDTLPETVVEILGSELIGFLAEAQKRGYKFRSVGELVGLKVYEDGSTDYDRLWKQHDAERKRANRVGKGDTAKAGEGEDIQAGDEAGLEGEDSSGEGTDDGTKDMAEEDKGDQKSEDGKQPGENGFQPDEQSPDEGGKTDNLKKNEEENKNDALNSKDKSRRQRVAPAQNPDEEAATDGADPRAGTNRRPDDPTGQGEEDRGNRRGGRRGGPRQAPDGQGGGAEGDTQGQDEPPRGRGGPGRFQNPRAGDGQGTGDDQSKELEPGNKGDGAGEGAAGQGKTDGTGTGAGGKTKKARGTPVESPVVAEDMDVLMDRMTVSSQPVLRGLINVNTAAPAVLKAIPGLTDEEVQAIAGRRGQLGGEDKMTPAWLVSSGVLSPEKFMLISNMVTARSIQFTVDVIGFADHVGTAQRIQAVVEMQGQLAQIKYYRDITSLGIGYPLDGDQQSEAFELDDRR